MKIVWKIAAVIFGLLLLMAVLLRITALSIFAQTLIPPAYAVHTFTDARGQVHNVLLPNLRYTPGAVRTTSEKEICDPSFRTWPYRNTTKEMKRQVYVEYGVERGIGVLRYGVEIDHSIPLWLGGSDSLEDLWAQPAPDYHFKDELEVRLHGLVCDEHSMSLVEAQSCIATDWASCYTQVFGSEPGE